MSLVGKKIVLFVDDPCDFTSPDGTNLIEARVVEFAQKGGAGRLVAEANHEVVVPDVRARGARLIMQPRHYGAKLSDLDKGKNVIVAVSIVPSGKPGGRARYALIGAVYIKGRESEEYSGFE